MQVDETEVILTLDKTRSLSRAAELLFMSRPGLSQKLASIESSYGRELYTRTSTGVVPTEAGQIVTRYARKVSQLESALAAELAASDEHFSSTIEVGMSVNDGAEILPRLVARFHEKHPDALVHLEAGYEPQLVKEVEDGTLDFAVVENIEAGAGMQTETLGYGVLEFCAPDKPPYNTATQPVPVKKILEWPMIIYEWDSGRHMVGNRQFRERYGISLMDHNMVARFDTHEAMINGAKAGLGWATIPHCIARKHRLDPGLIWFKVDTAPMRYPVKLLWKTDHIMSTLAMQFKEHVLEEAPKIYERRKTDDATSM